MYAFFNLYHYLNVKKYSDKIVDYPSINLFQG